MTSFSYFTSLKLRSHLSVITTLDTFGDARFPKTTVAFCSCTETVMGSWYAIVVSIVMCHNRIAIVVVNNMLVTGRHTEHPRVVLSCMSFH